MSWSCLFGCWPANFGGNPLSKPVTYSSLENPGDTFSTNSYRYRKIPEPEPDRLRILFTSLAYPVSYPFYTCSFLFHNIFQSITLNKKFFEKKLFFSDFCRVFNATELRQFMSSAWSDGVFYIYSPAFQHLCPGSRFPSPRAPPVRFCCWRQ